MSLVTANNAKIKKAFELLSMKKDYSAQMAMEKALKTAVMYALDFHEEDGMHGQHLEIGNHYGWLLTHNGELVSTSLYDAPIHAGTVGDFLSQFSSSIQESGWVGIVVAGMYIPSLPELKWSERFERIVIEAVVDYEKTALPVYFIQFAKRVRR